MVLFKFYSRVSYFNPLFIILGYNFYYAELNSGGEVLLITKKKIKQIKQIDEHIKFKRINDFTFMEC